MCNLAEINWSYSGSAYITYFDQMNKSLLEFLPNTSCLTQQILTNTMFGNFRTHFFPPGTEFLFTTTFKLLSEKSAIWQRCLIDKGFYIKIGVIVIDIIWKAAKKSPFLCVPATKAFTPPLIGLVTNFFPCIKKKLFFP